METSGINQVNFNGRVTAGVIDRAGVDLGDSHDVCSKNKLGRRGKYSRYLKELVLRSKRNLVSELSGPSELWWGALWWGGSSEAGGRLTENSIGEENPSYAPVSAQNNIPAIRSFSRSTQIYASFPHGLYACVLR